jgi:cyclic pyranopterin phosphate synthase
LSFKNIKVNADLLKGINDTYADFEKFGSFIKNNEIDFRFIELMQTGDNLDYFKKNHVSSKIFKDYLEKNNWIHQTFCKDACPRVGSDINNKFLVIRWRPDLVRLG